jgi:hypothetical protein
MALSRSTKCSSLWLGICLHRGKGLAVILKAIGFIIPLMDPEYALYYTKEVTVILIREFQTSDEEMKKIVLKVVKQCAATEGVTPTYIKQDILPDIRNPVCPTQRTSTSRTWGRSLTNHLRP